MLNMAHGPNPQGPVAAIFWLDDALESALRLDAIITLVDAKNIRRHLMQAGEHRNEAAMQVAYADRILVNKVCPAAYRAHGAGSVLGGELPHNFNKLQARILMYLRILLYFETLGC